MNLDVLPRTYIVTLSALALYFASPKPADADPLSFLDAHGLLDRADTILTRLAGHGDAWTREWTSAIRDTADSVRAAESDARRGIDSAVLELNRTGARLEMLLERAQQALDGFRYCTGTDLRYLLATTDASLSAIMEANVFWNRSGPQVAAGHIHGRPSRQGMRTGAVAIFELEGAFPRFNEDCGRPSARILPVVLDRVRGIPTVFSGEIQHMDSRRIVVKVPALPVAGSYKLEVAFQTSSGFFNTCDDSWSYARWVFPVSQPTDYAASYRLTAACWRLEQSSQSFTEQRRSDNGSSSSFSRTVSPNCWVEKTSIEHVSGDNNPHISLTDNSRTIHFEVRSQPRECRRRVAGTCIDWLNHFGEQRLHYTVTCAQLKEDTLRPIEGTFEGGIRAGGSYIANVRIPSLKGYQDGRMCRWALLGSLYELSGRQIAASFSVTAEQSPAPNVPSEGRLAKDFFTGGTATTSVTSNLEARDRAFKIDWSPANKTVRLSIDRRQTCELFD